MSRVETDRPLSGRVALVYGGGGAIGGAAARAFARDGAHVFVLGRTREKLDAVVRDVIERGGRAQARFVDALDERSVEKSVEAIVHETGRVDVALNAVGVHHVQGTPLLELPLDEFLLPVDVHVRTNFLTARAVARVMTRQKSGVILTMSTPGARLTGVGFMGNGTASSAVEAFSRLLAGEVAAAGIRVVCLRPTLVPESLGVSHVGQVFEAMLLGSGRQLDEFLAEWPKSHALLGRLPTLAEVAESAAFFASDRAGAATGAIVNLSCGALVD